MATMVTTSNDNSNPLSLSLSLFLSTRFVDIFQRHTPNPSETDQFYRRHGRLTEVRVMNVLFSQLVNL